MNKEPEKLFKNFDVPAYEVWSALSEKTLKGKKICDLKKTDYNGMTIEPIYTRDNVAYVEEFGATEPGEFPFVRGISSIMNKQRFKVCQEITNRSPKDFNKQLRQNLNTGQDSIYAKLITAEESNDQNVTGTIVNGISDIEIMFQEIDISRHELFVSVSTTSISLLEYFKSYVLQKDLSHKISCNVCIDPIEELIDSGKELYDNKEIYKWLLNEFPNNEFNDFRVLYVNGCSYSDRGASSVQEIAFAFSHALYVIYELLDNGFNINLASSTIHFSFAVNSNFFEEIAKFRALRVIWSNLMHQLGADDEHKKIKFRVVSARSNKSSLDKETNILRCTTETLSAVISGCETISVDTFNNLIEPDDAFAHRVAKNIQLILSEECSLKNPIDPAGGSWYIETLTTEIIKKIWEMMRSINSNGGFIEALKSGYIQNSILEIKKLKYNSLAQRKNTMIGVNKYPNLKDNDQLAIRDQIKNSSSKANQNLENNLKIAKGKLNIEPLEKYCADKQFFEFRTNAAKYKAEHGHQPEIFICPFGTVKEYKARLDFTRDFLAVGGISFSNDSKEYVSFDEIAKDFLASNLDLFVLCSSDEMYNEHGIELIKTIKKTKADSTIILAGNPTGIIDELYEAGLDLTIHIKSNIIEVIEKLHDKMQVRIK